jgi:hypothetical protein
MSAMKKILGSISVTNCVTVLLFTINCVVLAFLGSLLRPTSQSSPTFLPTGQPSGQPSSSPTQYAAADCEPGTYYHGGSCTLAPAGECTPYNQMSSVSTG